MHVGLKFSDDGSWRPHFAFRKGRYYEMQNRAGLVPRQRAERIALNASTHDEVRSKWAKAIGKTEDKLTYKDAVCIWSTVRIVALDETMAPRVSPPDFRRATLEFMRDVALARFGGRLI